MKTLNVVLFVLCTMILSACLKPSKQASKIEGLWISNDETSRSFPSGIQQSVFRFEQIPGGNLSVQGIFVWNGDYSSEWEISNFKYLKNSQSIEFTDGDGDNFKGTLDKINKRIVLKIYFENDEAEIPSDSIILIPADKDIESQLFHPRLNDNLSDKNNYQTPVQLQDGVQTASIHDEGINEDSINSLIDRIIKQQYGRVESLLILKDHKLLVEEYFYGYKPTSLHNIYSCTKSISSLLLGIALDRNKNVKVDQAIFSFFPELDSIQTKEKAQISLKHVLSMTAGFQWNEYPGEMYKTENRLAYVLNLPMESKPGEVFLYNSGLSALTGGIIARLEGEDLKQFADQYLFNPLGITEYLWRRDQNNEPELWNGLKLKPRDMAKIGLLVLNNGKWQNQQIVSENWMKESTSVQSSPGEYFEYGYQWWLRTGDTKQWWNESEAVSMDEYPMVIALGSGGQFIMIVKELNLVVVTTASNFNNDKDLSTIAMVIEEIIPLINNVGP